MTVMYRIDISGGFMRKFILLCIFMLFNVSATANNPPSAEGTQTEPEISLGWGYLPAKFTAANIETVWKRIHSMVGEKTEFESEDTYEKRAKETISYKLGKRKNLLLGFIGTKKPHYYAEKSVYPIYISPSGVNLKEKRKDGKAYYGTNAFGTTVKVTKSTAEEYNLRFSNQLRSNRNIEFPLDSVDAKRIHDKLYFVYVCRLAYPYAEETCRSSKPTIDLPYDVFTWIRNLHVELVAVWLVRMDSRKILLRVMPDKQGVLTVCLSPKEKEVKRELGKAKEKAKKGRKAIEKVLIFARNYKLNGMTGKAKEILTNVINAYPEAPNIETAKELLNSISRLRRIPVGLVF